MPESKLIKLNILNKKSKRALTIVEVMIAIAIFSIIFILVMNFMTTGFFETSIGMTKADNLREARLALSFFERDVREAVEIIDFDDNENFTNIQLKRYKFDKRAAEKEFEYVVYTLYKAEQTIAGQKLPIALCKTIIAHQPAITDVSIEPIIKGVRQSASQVGIIKSAIDKKTNNEIVTEIAAYGMHYDPVFLNIPGMAYDDLQKERARARYMGKFNGALLGFTDKKKIVAIELTFVTNDQRNNANIYRSFIYNRKVFYDKLTDGNF